MGGSRKQKGRKALESDRQGPDSKDGKIYLVGLEDTGHEHKYRPSSLITSENHSKRLFRQRLEFNFSYATIKFLQSP